MISALVLYCKKYCRNFIEIFSGVPFKKDTKHMNRTDKTTEPKILNDLELCDKTHISLKIF